MAAALPTLRLSAAEKKPDRPAKPKLDVAAGPMKELFTGTGSDSIRCRRTTIRVRPASRASSIACGRTARRASRRIFYHNTVEQAWEIAEAMRLERVYNPPEGRPVWGTHLSMALNGSQQDCEREYPKGIVSAYDGLTVML